MNNEIYEKYFLVEKIRIHSKTSEAIFLENFPRKFCHGFFSSFRV